MIKHPQTVFDIETRFQNEKHTLATKLQSTWRRYVARKRYLQLRTSVIRCQKIFRHRLHCIRLQKIKEYEIVIHRIVYVQKNIRRLLAVRAYRKTLIAAYAIRKYIVSSFSGGVARIYTAGGRWQRGISLVIFLRRHFNHFESCEYSRYF